MAKSARNGKSNTPTAKALNATAALRIGKIQRPITAGDTVPNLEPQRLEKFVVDESIASKQDVQAEAIRDVVENASSHDVVGLANSLRAILKRASPDDAAMLRSVLREESDASVDLKQSNRDTALADDWRNGEYPYKYLLSRKSYEKQKYHLQVELLKLQAWVKSAKQKVVILFEGRDAAGKGGTIKRFMEHLNPRGARVVALE